MKKKIIFIGTDTLHRRFFLNEIAKLYEIKKIFFEEYKVNPSFDIKSSIDLDEKTFESNNFNVKSFEHLKDKIKLVYRGHDQEVKDYIKNEKIDLAIIFGAAKLNNEVLNLLNDYAINIHRGIAEEYRGLDSNLWAVYHKDYKNTGVTLHKAIDILDKGDIYMQKQIRYPDNIMIYKMRYYETILAKEMILNFLLDYHKNNVKFEKQSKEGRYYSFMPGCLKETLNLKGYLNKQK